MVPGAWGLHCSIWSKQKAQALLWVSTQASSSSAYKTVPAEIRGVLPHQLVLYVLSSWNHNSNDQKSIAKQICPSENNSNELLLPRGQASSFPKSWPPIVLIITLEPFRKNWKMLIICNFQMLKLNLLFMLKKINWVPSPFPILKIQPRKISFCCTQFHQMDLAMYTLFSTLTTVHHFLHN